MKMALCKIMATNAVTESVELFDFKESPQCYVIDKPEKTFFLRNTYVDKIKKDKIENLNLLKRDDTIILQIWCFENDIKTSQGALRHKMEVILSERYCVITELLNSFKKLYGNK